MFCVFLELVNCEKPRRFIRYKVFDAVSAVYNYNHYECADEIANYIIGTEKARPGLLTDCLLV